MNDLQIMFWLGIVLIIVGLVLLPFNFSSGGASKIKLPVIELEINGPALLVMFLGSGLMWFSVSKREPEPGEPPGISVSDKVAADKAAADKAAADRAAADKAAADRAAADKAAADRAAADRAAADKAAADRAAADKAAPVKAVMGNFITRVNRDIYGQDIPSQNGQIGIPGLNVNECAESCVSLKACLAFTFDRWNGRCYLKNKVVTSIVNPRAIIAVKKPLKLPDTSKAMSETKTIRNHRFQGEPFARSTVTDFQACKALCENDLGCIAFSFSKAVEIGQNCEVFKQSEKGYLDDDSADSGWKQQSP
jgi:hypothetical protein